MRKRKSQEIKTDEELESDKKIRDYNRNQSFQNHKNRLIILCMYIALIIIGILLFIVIIHNLISGEFSAIQRYMELGVAAVGGYILNEVKNKKEH